MTDKAKAFLAANAKSPVVYGSVITRHRRGNHEPPDPVGCYYRLKDGSVWKLTSAECADVGYPRWDFETADVAA